MMTLSEVLKKPRAAAGSLSVIIKHRNKYYDLLMYHDTMELGTPVILVQTIVFLVRLIEDTDPERLIEYLHGISPDPLIPHEIEDKKFRDSAQKLLELKIRKVQDLIREDKARHN